MFKIPEIIITKVSKFVSDEIHITGKQSKKPTATLSFVAEDENGSRISNSPVAVVRLEGEAFNQWFESWNSENDLYSKLLELLKNNTPGISVEGVDLSKISLNDISISDKVEEIV